MDNPILLVGIAIVALVVFILLKNRKTQTADTKTPEASATPATSAPVPNVTPVPAAAPVAAPAPVATPVTSAAPAAPIRPETVAAISAALAETLGTSINGIRIHSIRQLSGAEAAMSAPVATPVLPETVAAISAALAEALGTHVSSIRIHSIRQLSGPGTPAAASVPICWPRFLPHWPRRWAPMSTTFASTLSDSSPAQAHPSPPHLSAPR